MHRFSYLALLFVGAVALTAGGFYVLTYGADTPPPRAALEGLASNAYLHTYEDGLPLQLVTATPEDVPQVLGFAQGSTLAWPILVARQLARARTAEWVGREGLTLDRHAALLDLDAGVDSLLATLSPSDRAYVQDFARGVDAGLQQARAHNRFVALAKVEFDPFTASDVLAIERLFAWMATDLTWPDSTALSNEAQAFVASDSLFRRALGVFGWSNSAAWSYTDSTGALLAARYETGASALPALFECLVVAGTDTSFSAFIPGTPFALAASSAAAHVVVPRGEARLMPVQPTDWRSQTRALRVQGGAVVPFVRMEQRNAVLVGPDTSQSAAWQLVWPGLDATTDATIWLHLNSISSPTPFSLLPDATVLVATPQPARFGEGLAYRSGDVSAPAPVATYLQQRLDTLARRADAAPEEWFSDTTSPWALAVHRQLVTRIDTALFTTPHHHVGYEFFNNWMGSYRGSSIGATLFDAFVNKLDLSPGAPSAALPDTSQPFVRARYTAQFAAVVDTIVQRYGSDPLDWRWQTMHEDERLFPLWSVRSHLALPFANPAFVQPFVVPGRGHPTTLAGGQAAPRTPRASLAIVLYPGAPLRTVLYRLTLDPAQPFARYRIEGHTFSPQTLAYPPEPASTRTLVPQ